MNKKLKKIAVIGVTVMMTASSVGVSNAMQVKKICESNLTGKTYVCINGKKYKLGLNCISIFDTLKWFDKNNCINKFPGINDDKDDNNENDNNENDLNNKNDNLEDNNDQNQENNSQDKEDNNQDSDSNKGQDKEDNNESDKGQDEEDNNQNDDNNQNQDKEDDNSSDVSDFSKEQVEVLNLVNKERKANGLKPLTLNKELSNVANIKSRDMIQKGYFDHTSPTYGSPFDMMKKFNISYKTAGENIAMGQKTPSEVMNAWMNSSGHRANILNSNYTELGVGIQKDAKGTIYWTQMFIGK